MPETNVIHLELPHLSVFTPEYCRSWGIGFLRNRYAKKYTGQSLREFLRFQASPWSTLEAAQESGFCCAIVVDPVDAPVETRQLHLYLLSEIASTFHGDVTGIPGLPYPRIVQRDLLPKNTRAVIELKPDIMEEIFLTKKYEYAFITHNFLGTGLLHGPLALLRCVTYRRYMKKREERSSRFKKGSV